MLETGSLLRHSTPNSLVVRAQHGSRGCAATRRCRPTTRPPRVHTTPNRWRTSWGGHSHRLQLSWPAHLTARLPTPPPSPTWQVLDELGRGTATHDGHAIAFGVALWLARERRCRWVVRPDCCWWSADGAGAAAAAAWRAGAAPAAAWSVLWSPAAQAGTTPTLPSNAPRLTPHPSRLQPSPPSTPPGSALFATHYHGLCQEPALARAARLAHMQAEVEPGRGLRPSFRLAPGAARRQGCLLTSGLPISPSVRLPATCHARLGAPRPPPPPNPPHAGPAPSGSCGIQVAAACQLPPSVIQHAAQVAQRAECGELPGGRGSSAGGSGSGSADHRQPLHERNNSLQPPAAKRARVADAAGGSAELAGEQQAALAAVRAALAAVSQGVPGAAEQLLRLQVAVRAALASGEL